MDNLYTVNEFAKICQTTKDTLLVYDRKGLLKPNTIGENGYRYYRLEQYYDFYVIKAFQMAGSSLKEISEQLNSNDRHSIVALLETKRGELIKRQFELSQMQKFIEKAIAQSDILDLDNGNIHIKYCPEEYYIAMTAEYDGIEQNEPKQFLKTYGELNNYIQKRGYSGSMLFEGNYIIPKENFNNDDFRFIKHCFKIPYKMNDPFLHIKPAGKYAMQYIKGNIADYPKHCIEFRNKIIGKGYKILDDVYSTHLSIGLFSFSESESIRLLSVKISE